MSGMWVAVTAEYGGSTFSHRASIDGYFPERHKALRDYNRLLDEAGGCVRRGFTGWLGPQDEPQQLLSEHEKLQLIEKIMHAPTSAAEAFNDIKAVLEQ